MMCKPKVSVLVTFYNQEKYVDKALESIVSQKTDFGIRILVGDDGSDDKTVAIVNEWISRYPDIFELFIMERNEEQQTPGFRASVNRLNLLAHVDTDYFTFLDGDDYFSYDLKLQKQVDILEKEENSDCIACGHNMYMQYDDGRRIPVMDLKLNEGKVGAKEYWRDLYCSTDTLLIRSSVISKLDTVLLRNHFDDIVITFSVIQYGKLYYFPEFWAVYTQTGDGIWTGGNEIENSVRSMMMFDMCLKINPKFTSQSKVRFSHIWKSLMKNRKNIDPDKLKPYSEEAKKKDLTYTYKWIHFSDLGLIERIKLYMMYISVRINKFMTRLSY